MKKIALVSVIGALVASYGCSSGSYYYNTAYTYPIAIDETSRAFVMPADLHVPGDAPVMSVAFMAGIASACGANCLPGQPLRPVLERMGINNLSWMLAEGMYHAASVHGGQTWDHDFATIPTMLSNLFTAINEAFPGANLRWIVVGHVDDLGGGMVPNVTKMRVLGGLFDIQQQQIATVFWYEESMPSDTVAVNVGMMGNRVIALSTCPMDDCEAPPAAENFNVVHF